MTLDEFFERLPRDGWAIGPVDCISRSQDGVTCPIYAACGEIGFADPIRKGMNLGLSAADATRLVHAVDALYDYDPALRARLLAHCQLPKERK